MSRKVIVEAFTLYYKLQGLKRKLDVQSNHDVPCVLHGILSENSMASLPALNSPKVGFDIFMYIFWNLTRHTHTRVLN